ncbi:GGDEF domain-containing protein, partial [Oharaeibacter diazotrophicus]
MARPSIVTKALTQAIFRIAVVSICAGAISYFYNRSAIDESVREQLLLTTEQKLQRESLPFVEIRDLEHNFLREFERRRAEPGADDALAADFDRFFVRRDDGSYVQRPGIFEGEPLADGRRFPQMSATYAPDTPPDRDVKARFALAFLLSEKYGSALGDRVFNFYGVVPEKGFPIHQSVDISKVFTYSGPDKLDLDDYEFYTRGFTATEDATIFTKIYYDYSNRSWMTTIATPGGRAADGRWTILASVDMPLFDLMQRTAEPTLHGSYSTIFTRDAEGTLVFDAAHTAAITGSAGQASIRSLGLADRYPVLTAALTTTGGVAIVTTADEIVAVGHIPGTPWALAIHYPKALMAPAILRNLMIVVLLGLATLVVEVFLLRSILQDQVARPLARLVRAAQSLGRGGGRFDRATLPPPSGDEIGTLAEAFADMTRRVDDAREQLEDRVRARTEDLEAINLRLVQLSTTDPLTGLANRRQLDVSMEAAWTAARSDGRPFALAMIDVDWFKLYNDGYGHQAGDACLGTVAARLRGAVPKGHLVARYGGEEFAVLMPDTDADAARRLCEALARSVGTPAIPHEGSPLGRVTISIGAVACGAGDCRGVDALLR